MGDGSMTNLYVCVHIPEFPAQALLRLRPDLARSAVVVLQGEAPLEQVCSANSRATRLGVCAGMTRAELDSFPELNLLRRSAQEERSAHAALLDAGMSLTPRMEVRVGSGSAWVMVLDMTGCRRVFGSEEDVLRRIDKALRKLRFFVRLAASSNFHAAVCLAASASRKPLVVPEGSEASYLAGLPLALLGLSARQAEVFELWGLHTIGELAALPEVDLIVRLGQEGKRLLLLARGEHPHLMVPEEPAFALEEFLELDHPIELLDSLLFVVGPMLSQLIVRAQNHALALASVSVRLGLEGGGEHTRTIKPALPVSEHGFLLKLLHLDLQTHPPAASVASVFLSAETGERGKVQLGLWSPQLPETMRLDVTLARIAALVGEDRVGCAALSDTHRPESFQVKRFAVPAAVEEEGVATSSVALRRCRPPIVVQMRHAAGRLNAFRFGGTMFRVKHAYGPWRRSGEWWSSQVWSSEEWDVEAMAQGGPETKLLCVISHDLLRQRWQVEALYD